MAFRAGDVIGILWSHPIMSVVVLLLFTPPFFPILVFFSPLLISTALFILAMVNMGSSADETPTYSIDASYKRGWSEEDEDDSPRLENEKVTKRLRASSTDESWFDKVRNWEGTGRAWMESVLSQETRKIGNSDYNAGPREVAAPLLATARELFSETTRRLNPEPATVSSYEVARDISVQKSEIVADQSNSRSEKSQNMSEITPVLESEDEILEIVPRSVLPSPLFRSRSGPKLDTPSNSSGEGFKWAKSVSSRNMDPSSTNVEHVMGNGGSVQRRELGEETKATPDLKLDRLENRNASAAEVANTDTETNALVEEAERKRPVDESKIVASIRNDSESSSVETNSEKGLGENGVADINPAVEGLANGNGSFEKTATNLSLPNAQPREVKSAAEALAPFRQWKANSQGTPSAAVALSEKLRVPLEDIMSLLAGEDKENIPTEGAEAKEGSSSSETTTSQEEEWSSSDEESSAPLEPDSGPPPEKDN